MKLSSKARYGLKVMCFLAEHIGEGAMPLSVISNAVESSDKYIEQIIMALRKSDLVKATRGVLGGYYIENPDEISVGAILRTLEDGLVIADCLVEGNECPNKAKCHTHDVWDKLYQEINNFLDTMTLTSIIKK